MRSISLISKCMIERDSWEIISFKTDKGIMIHLNHDALIGFNSIMMKSKLITYAYSNNDHSYLCKEI